MPVVEKKILLDAAREDVWRFITDPGHFQDYVEGYTRGQVLSQHATGPGSAFRWQTPLGPLTLECEEKVVEWAENERVAYQGAMAGGTFQSELCVRPMGRGMELTVRINYEPPLGRVGLALDRLFLRRTVAGHVAHSLDQLRRVFERTGEPAEAARGLGDKAVSSTYSMWGGTGLYDASAAVTFMFREKEIRGRAVERLALEPGARVLDLCCGTGLNHPQLMRGVGPGGEITGLDYTRAMLDRAEARRRRHGWHNVELVQGDAARLCFPDGHFDAVLCVLGISAVSDFTAALRHAVRVCKPGGRVAICDGHPFTGRLEPLNALMVPIYRRLACWDHGKDITGELEKLVPGLRVEWFNGGTIYIASGTTRASARPAPS